MKQYVFIVENCHKLTENIYKTQEQGIEIIKTAMLKNIMSTEVKTIMMNGGHNSSILKQKLSK